MSIDVSAMQQLDIEGLVPTNPEVGTIDRVHRRIYVDPAVFEAEMEKIYGRTWIYVGHESEVANPGDYKTTTIGLQPVILSRDEDGQIHVLYNRCAHRAATVCQDERGNSNFFRCAYHGWTYRNSGALVGVPYAEAYDPKDFDQASFGLGRVPRMDIHRGFIFASLSPEGRSLQEHLGPAADYLSVWADQSPEGNLIMRNGTSRYSYNGNWKLQMDNGPDGYHANHVHQSLFASRGAPGGSQNIFSSESKAVIRDLGNGHTAADTRSGRDPARRGQGGEAEGMGGAPKEDVEEYRRRLVEGLGKERAEKVLDVAPGSAGNLTIFPNLIFVSMHIRVVRPRAVDRTDIELFPMTLAGAPESVNLARLRTHEPMYGPAGGVAPDDVEMFRRQFQGLRVQGMEWLVFLRGLRRERKENGHKVGHVADEIGMRGYYTEWKRLMEA